MEDDAVIPTELMCHNQKEFVIGFCTVLRFYPAEKLNVPCEVFDSLKIFLASLREWFLEE